MGQEPGNFGEQETGMVAPHTPSTSVAPRPLPGSRKVVGRSRLIFGAVVTVGIAVLLSYPTPSEAQGQLVDPASQNSAQASMANSINTFCPVISALPNPSGETAALSDICTGMVTNATTGYQLSQEELNAATQTLNGEESQAMQQQFADVRATQAHIAERMELIRTGVTGLSFAGLTLDGGEQILPAGYEDDILAGEGDVLVGEGGALSTPIWNNLGVFVTGGGSFGDKSESGKVTGYDFYSVGLTAGADYRIRPDLAAGGAVTWSYYDADFDDDQNNPSGQDLDSNSVIFSFFGTYFTNRDSLIPWEGFFLDGMASFGWSFLDMSRRVVVPNSNNPALPDVNDKANSDTKAFQYGFAGNVGYEFNVGAFAITPVGRVRYIHVDIDDYEESGASPLNLEVGDQDAESLTTHLGASLGYAFSTQYGVIQPEIRGEYVHEFEDDNDGGTIRYAADPTGASAFDVITEGSNKNYGIVGAALIGTLAGGWSAFVDFETPVGYGDFDIYTFRLGARREF